MPDRPKRHLSPVQWLFLLTFSYGSTSSSGFPPCLSSSPNGGDMKFYSDWGLQVAHGVLTDHQAFYGLPGYPFLLGFLFKILNFDRFGVSIFAGLIQSLADAFTSVFIWKIASEAFRREAGRASASPRAARLAGMAAVGWALYQPAQAFSAVLMPTALAVAAYWYCVWVLMRRREGAVLHLGALAPHRGADRLRGDDRRDDPLRGAAGPGRHRDPVEKLETRNSEAARNFSPHWPPRRCSSPGSLPALPPAGCTITSSRTSR